jgi:Uma2 family endonuclease
VSRLDDEFPNDREEDPVTVAYEVDAQPSGGWTFEDIGALPVHSARRELIDGALILSPSPAPFHQTLAARLCAVLIRDCPGHLEVTQAAEVRIDEKTSLIPDVLIVGALAGARKRGCLGPSDVILAVEIVSPSSTTMDRFLKPAVLAEARVPLYWCIETEGEVSVHTFRLDDTADVYRATGVFTDVITVDEPWKIHLPIADLLPRRYKQGS